MQNNLNDDNINAPYGTDHWDEEDWARHSKVNGLDEVIKVKDFLGEKISDLAQKYPKVAKTLEFTPVIGKTTVGAVAGFMAGGPAGAVVGGLAGLESGIQDMIIIEAINHTIGNQDVKKWIAERAANVVKKFKPDTSIENTQKRIEFFEDIFQLVASAKVYSKIKNIPKFDSPAKFKPLGRGSTGRSIPNNLKEHFALQEIMNNPGSGKIIKSNLSDSRWRGWHKMSNETARDIEIHFNAQIIDGRIINIDDFKFVDLKK